MTSSPTFAVLVPVYNGQATIRRCLDSVLAQTRPADQIVVCDDGSTDETPGILRSYGSAVEVVTTANGGLSRARNNALERARTDFVVLLDADDEWAPGRLTATEAALDQTPAADIVTTDALIVWDDGRPVQRWYDEHPFPRTHAEQRVEILRRNFVFVSSAVRRSSLEDVGGFEEGLPHDSEYPTWARIVLSGGLIIRTEEPLAIYHRSPDALSGDRAGTYRMILAMLDRLEADYRLDGDQLAAVADQRRTVHQQLLPHEALAALEAEPRTARSLLWKLAGSPHLPLWKRLLCACGAVAPRLARVLVGRLPARLRPTPP